MVGWRRRVKKVATTIKGLHLARAFFWEAVNPIISRELPRASYSAALIGSGSEVLGYDDAVSTDHHWGPRVMLFLTPEDRSGSARRLQAALAADLPYQFMGYPTNFSPPKEGEGDQGTQILQEIDSGAINHRVEILTIERFLREYLGIGAKQRLSAADWLSIPQQKLLSFTAGEVFHDDLGLQGIRDQLRYYPYDVWLYMLAAGWRRIGQDEHLAPRAGAVGDELGSALIAGRLTRSIIALCFLYENRYAPYSKWLGTAFASLACADELSPTLRAVQTDATWREREARLCAAYDVLNRLHNASGLTAPIAPAVQHFHGRGFRVSGAWRYCDALLALVDDPNVKAIGDRTLIGNIDQFSESADLRESADYRGWIAGLYGS